MLYRLSRFSLTAVAAACTCLLAVPALAADAATDDATLPGVSVTASPADTASERTEMRDSYRALKSSTATGLSLSARDTPQSLSTVTRQQMTDFGLNTVNDVLQTTPGVTVERVETDRTYYTARGFDVENFQLDGVGLPFTNGAQWGDVDTVVYDHIDVLRGANGLLSGSGLPSATVNFVPKKATEAFQASLGVTLGSWNKKRVEGDVSGKLNADGSVRGRIVGAVEDRDSYLDRYSKKLNSFYGTVDIDVTRDTTVTLGLLDQTSKAKGPMWGALPMTYADGSSTNYDVSTSTAADWTWWNNHERRLTADVVHDMGGGWTLKTNLSHRTQQSDSELLYVFGSQDASTGTGLYAYPSAFKGRYTQDLASVQAAGGFNLGGRRHEASLGLNWAHEKASELSTYASYNGSAYTELNTNLATWDGSFAKPSFDASSDGSQYSSQRVGGHAAARWSLTDSFKLITGTQVVHLSSTGENYGVAHAYDTTRLTPYLGGVFRIDPQWSAYASWSSIFKPQTQINAQAQVLAPAKGSNAEVGLKAELLGKRLSLNAAVFKTKLKGLADSGTWDSALLTTVYAGENTISQGIELEAVGRLASSLEVSGSITHQRITDESGNDARTYIPRDMVKVGLRYKPFDKLSTTAALRWQSAISRTDSGVETNQSAYALLDVGASYQIDQHWRASLQIKNVMDQKYINSLYWSQAYYGAPRSGEVSVNYTF